MKYEDSQGELPSPSHRFEPQTPAIKPLDSESYGSLHSDDQSEDGVLDQLKVTDELSQAEVKVMKQQLEGSDGDRRVDTEGHLSVFVVETNQSKHTQSRFCVVL